MRQNHDAFAARLSERIADWDVLVKLFADAGLTDRYGNSPKPETARKTWQRVRHKVAEVRSRKPGREPAQRVIEQLAPPNRPMPTSVPADRADIRAMLSTGRKLPDPI